MRSDRARLLALGGGVGPAAFIVAWIVAGAWTAGYSPIDDAISRLAAVGAPHRVLMTAGLVCFAVALPVYAAALRCRLPGPAWAAATTTGVATLGVALFPLGMSSRLDGVHNAMAAAGYLSLVAVPLLAAPHLVRSHRSAAIASLVVAAGGGVCLAATLLGPVHGLTQRVGLTLVDLWLITSALVMAGTPLPSQPPSPGPQAQRSARS